MTNKSLPLLTATVRVEEYPEISRTVTGISVPEDKDWRLWVVPDLSEKHTPYFQVMTPFFPWEAEKTARISFLSPLYIIPEKKSELIEDRFRSEQTPFRKVKNWFLSESEIERLITAFNQIVTPDGKTAWQYAVECWNYELSSEVGKKFNLPENLQMPDYTLLAQKRI